MEHWWASQNELALLLNLTRVNGIGQARLRRLVQNLRCPSNILAVSPHELTTFGGINKERALAVRKAASDRYGELQLAKASAFGCEAISFWDSRYPAKLRNIPDPPILIFVKGKLEVLNKFAIAIVGTRVPTPYGRNITAKITRDLIESGMTIVSGLARGIDTIAHSETVKAGGHTIAVLGSGFDQLYPPENGKLATEICKNGAVISELPFGAKPDAMNFPRRNRIISGLAAGTVVTEAGEKSGALITAYLAIEQNREVFAVPGSVFSPKNAGPNRLIKEGAKLVTSVDDIFVELPRQGELFANSTMRQDMAREFSIIEKEILAVLRDGEKHIDKLSHLLNKSTPLLLSALLKLELDGVVQQQPGQIFLLNKSY